MRRWLVAGFLGFASLGYAHAQIPGNVQQYGNVTPGDCTKWYGTGIIEDSGGACGGSSSPGGSNTQLQYNNSSSFGGISGATSNGTAVTFASTDLIFNGGSGTNGDLITTNGSGVLADSGTLLSSLAPLASPTFTGTVTFPGGGTATTSGFGSLTALGVGESVPSAGQIYASSTIRTNAAGSVSSPSIVVGNSSTGFYSVSTTGLCFLDVNGTCYGDYGISVGSVISFGSATVKINGTLNANGQTISNVSSLDGAAASTLSVFTQNTSAGSTAAGNLNLTGGNATGSGASSNGGSVVITPGTSTNGTAGTVQLVNITSDAALTDNTLCYNTTSHNVYYGSGTLGICLGTSSSIRFKPDYALIGDGLGVINALDPGTWHYRNDVEDGGKKLNAGFTAERYASIDALRPFTRYDAEGRPSGVDMLASYPFAVRAIQQVDDKVIDLQGRMTAVIDSCREAANNNFCAQLLKRVGEL